MEQTNPEKDESWTESGVQLVLEQPTAVRERRAGVWLFGLVGLAVALVPLALGFLFVPMLAPFIGITALVFAIVAGWTVLPPLVVARLNRPVPVVVGDGELKIGDEVFERGSIRSVAMVDGAIEVERRDGTTFRSVQVVPVDTERLMRLLDFVEVSDDEAEADALSRREALRRLRPLQNH